MLSCTEFIPLYSELFKYIEEKADHDAVVRYWQHIAENYVEPRLGKLVEEKGIEGCWDYWTKALNEEAADFTITYDEEEQEFEITMHYCPSKGLLLKLTHMEPYHDYCGHCAHLYAPILKKYGLESDEDYSETDKAKCRIKFYVPKK
ncbi:MAG: hypothetical protein GX783_10865 [Clostridiales bacterium]|nr:hypothetical protein [Clostridiales bacterium]